MRSLEAPRLADTMDVMDQMDSYDRYDSGPAKYNNINLADEKELS